MRPWIHSSLLCVAGWAAALSAVIWSGYWLAVPIADPKLNSVRNDFIAWVGDVDFQSLLLPLLVLNLVIMCGLLLRSSDIHSNRRRTAVAHGLILVLGGISVAHFYVNPKQSAYWLSLAIPDGGQVFFNQSAFALVGGCWIGLTVAFLLNRKDESHKCTKRWHNIYFGMLAAVSATGFFYPDWSAFWMEFEYRDSSRWMGPMFTSNDFGTLMCCAVLLALGNLLELRSQRRRNDANSPASSGYRRVVECGNLLLLGWLIIALLGSFCRGAWVAAVIGGLYLASRSLRSSESDSNWLRSALPLWRRNALPLGCLLISISVISFWTLRHSEHRIPRRIFSVANINDFSMINRLAAYEVTLNMIGDRPLTGFGWNRPRPTSASFYLPPRLESQMAIFTNDFLFLAATLGLPALLCLIGYVFLKLTPPRSPPSPIGSRDGECWRGRSCRAAAIALLVVFWFDGCLFKLTVAVPFWILLELGAARVQSIVPSDDSGVWQRARSPLGLLCFVTLCLLCGLFWADRRDPFQRTEFGVELPSGGKLNGMAICPRVGERHPTAVYFRDPGASLESSGKALRLLAELGLAAFAFESSPIDDPSANRESITAVLDIVSKAPFASDEAVCWIGEGAAVAELLTLVQRKPESCPRLLALVGVESAHAHALASMAKMRSADLVSEFELLLLPHSLPSGGESEEFEWSEEWFEAQGIPTRLTIAPDSQGGATEIIRPIAEFCARVSGARRRALTHNPRKHWQYWIPCLVAAILLVGCGRVGVGRPASAPRDGIGMKSGPRWLGWLAATSAGIAIILSTVHLALPRMNASPAVLKQARGWLVGEGIRGDFEYLSGLPISGKTRVRTLLEHAELANYRGAFLYEELDRRTWQEHVLSPMVDGSYGHGLDWRRPLWLYFYPRVRNETNPLNAANTVVAFLRERVSIDAAASKSGILSCWDSQTASEQDWERLYLAALRSVTVAARMSAGGFAEIWTGTRWEAAPRPAMGAW